MDPDRIAEIISVLFIFAMMFGLSFLRRKMRDAKRKAEEQDKVIKSMDHDGDDPGTNRRNGRYIR